jgi:hypothetical protein
MKVDLAVIKEKEGAESGAYPPEWPETARKVKEANGWKCERCGRPNDYENGYTLTVHHLDGNKWNLEPWNLAALCQRCHLQVQNKIDFYTDSLDGVHREWMAKHVTDYNVWAIRNNKSPLLLTKIVPNKASYDY